MKIVVFGTGAVGAFFGGLLAQAGADVHFIARGAQLDALRRNGIRIRSTLLGEITAAPVRATAQAAQAGPADLVLVCVKTHQTPDILDDLAALMREGTLIVTLQNGVESDDVLAARFGRDRVIPGVVYVGATIDEPGTVTHVAAGSIAIGGDGVAPQQLERVRSALAASGQPVTITDDIRRERWHKLIWNAAFNTVSAVTNRPPHDLLARPETRALLRGIMAEVVAVAAAQGIALSGRDPDRQIAWTEAIGTIRTSMMVDRAHGRSMEIDALIGVVVRRGEALGVPTPLSAAMNALLLAMA